MPPLAHTGTFTEALARSTALRSFFMGIRLRITPVDVTIVLVTVGALIYLATRQNPPTFLIGLITGLVLAVVLIFAVILLISVTYSGRRIAEMKSRTATFHLEDAVLRVESELGSVIVEWAKVKHLWKFPLAWVIVSSGGQRVTIPTDHASQEFLIAFERKASPNNRWSGP
jgi:hypothetical protein